MEKTGLCGTKFSHNYVVCVWRIIRQADQCRLSDFSLKWRGGVGRSGRGGVKMAGGRERGLCRTRARVGVREEPCIGFDFPAPTISGLYYVLVTNEEAWRTWHKGQGRTLLPQGPKSGLLCLCWQRLFLLLVPAPLGVWIILLHPCPGFTVGIKWLDLTSRKRHSPQVIYFEATDWYFSCCPLTPWPEEQCLRGPRRRVRRWCRVRCWCGCHVKLLCFPRWLVRIMALVMSWIVFPLRGTGRQR